MARTTSTATEVACTVTGKSLRPASPPSRFERPADRHGTVERGRTRDRPPAAHRARGVARLARCRVGGRRPPPRRSDSTGWSGRPPGHQATCRWTGLGGIPAGSSVGRRRRGADAGVGGGGGTSPAFLALMLAGVAGRVAVADGAVEAAGTTPRGPPRSPATPAAESAARTAARGQLDSARPATARTQHPRSRSEIKNQQLRPHVVGRGVRPPLGEPVSIWSACTVSFAGMRFPGCRWATNGSRPPSAPAGAATGAGSDRAPTGDGPDQPLPHRHHDRC